MPPTTSYKFGDVVLVPFPFTDLSTTKQRPAAVVSSTTFNKARADLILMAITSQVSPRASALNQIRIADWRAAGLLKESILKPVVFTLEKRLVRKKLGSLDTTTVDALQGALLRILG